LRQLSPTTSIQIRAGHLLLRFSDSPQLAQCETCLIICLYASLEICTGRRPAVPGQKDPHRCNRHDPLPVIEVEIDRLIARHVGVEVKMMP
jgi:hypothetical protein